MSFFANIRKLDAYTKPVEDFRERTVTGAIITILCSILCLILFLSEVRYYLTTEIISELQVDNSRGKKMVINLDISMSQMPCNYFSIDAMDVSGERADAEHQLYKVRMKDGVVVDTEKVDAINTEKLTQNKTETALAVKDECGSCYGAETEKLKCCNTCEEVQNAYREKGWGVQNFEQFDQCQKEGFQGEDFQATKGESCRIHGHLEVNRVSGSIHIAPGKTVQIDGHLVHDVRGMRALSHDTSHTIHHFSFGDEFPSQINPLDDTDHKSDEQNLAWHYYLKIVPTEFRPLSGSVLRTNQYSVTRHEKQIHPMSERLPGLFMSFDIAPIAVTKTETRRSLVHFATSVCAIVGGIWTISSILDSAIYRTNKMMIKTELGKVG